MRPVVETLPSSEKPEPGLPVSFKQAQTKAFEPLNTLPLKAAPLERDMFPGFPRDNKTPKD